MNKDYTFYKNTGEITFNVNCSDEVLSSLLQTSEDSYIAGNFSSETYYIEAGVAIEKPVQPSRFHIFNYTTKIWELSSLDTAKNSYKMQINSYSGDIILSRYPYYRQLNNIGTSEYEPMRLYIDSIRDKSNLAASQIDLTTTTDECQAILDTFIAEIA